MNQPASEFDRSPAAGREPAPAPAGEPRSVPPADPAGPNPYPVPPYQPTPEKPAPPVSTAQGIFALIALLLGYLYLKWVYSPVSYPLFVLAMLGFTAAVWILTRRGRKAARASAETGLPVRTELSPAAVIALIPALVAAILPLFVPDRATIRLNPVVGALSFLFAWLYAFSSSPEAPFSDSVFLDGIKAVFVQPFGSFGRLFPALGGLFRKKKSRAVGWVLLGILIAVIPTVIVTALLSGADEAFRQILVKIGDALRPDRFAKEFGLFLLGVPIALCLFGAVYSGMTERFARVLDRDAKRRVSDAVGILPVPVTVAAAVPLFLVYALFFFSQLGYFLDAFSGLVPEGYLVSEYARAGFFQLCAVAAINLVLILGAGALTKKKDGRPALGTRIVNGILSVMTLVLIATALRKMILYIGFFGYTRLRVIPSIFMIFLALSFLFLLLRQIFVRFPAARAALIAGTVLFLATGASDIDARIAGANVRLYQTGALPSCDVKSFYSLSFSAAPEVIPLLGDADPEIAAQARTYLTYTKETLDETLDSEETGYDWRDRTPAHYRVRRQLKEALGS